MAHRNPGRQVRERMLLFCVANGIDWQRAAVIWRTGRFGGTVVLALAGAIE